MKNIPLTSMAMTALILVGCSDPSISVSGPLNTEEIPGGSLENVLLNDTSGDTLLNYWTCVYPDYPDAEPLSFAFFPNNSGLIFNSVDSSEIAYAVSGNVVDVSVDGDYYLQLKDVNVLATGQYFELIYSFADGSGTGGMFCHLVGEVPAPGFNQNVYATNSSVSEGITSAWQCAVNDVSPVMIALLVNGLGVFFSETYSEGVLLSWTADSQGIYLELGGDQVKVIASNARLENGDLVADSIIIDGTNAGSLRCEMVEIQ